MGDLLGRGRKCKTTQNIQNQIILRRVQVSEVKSCGLEEEAHTPSVHQTHGTGERDCMSECVCRGGEVSPHDYPYLLDQDLLWQLIHRL